MSRVAAATMASRVGFPSRGRAVPVVIVYRPVGTEITHGRRPASSREISARHFRYFENHRSAGPRRPRRPPVGLCGSPLVAEEAVAGAGVDLRLVGLSKPAHRLFDALDLIERDQLVLLSPERQHRRLDASEQGAVAGEAGATVKGHDGLEVDGVMRGTLECHRAAHAEAGDADPGRADLRPALEMLDARADLGHHP